MPLDDPIVVVWDAGFTEREVDAVVEAMRAAGLSTPAALIHAAIYNFITRQLDLKIPTDLFGAPVEKRQ
jgi:hypothetical protein